MIRLRIKGKPELKEEKIFHGVLYMEETPDHSGDINLMVKSIEDNFDWFILRLKTDGTFSRTSLLPNDIGLQIDDDGRIIESEE